MDSTYTYLVEYSGQTIETVVTKKATSAEEWMKNVRTLFCQTGEKYRIVGINSKFINHPIKSMSGKLALLQLCVGTTCLILQMQHIDSFSQPIREFLLDDSITFVGIETDETSMKLSNEYQMKLGKVLDLRLVVAKWYPMSYGGRPGLKTLARGIAGLLARKGRDCNGDWESIDIDDELVERACCDAYASYCIAREMFAEISFEDLCTSYGTIDSSEEE